MHVPNETVGAFAVQYSECGCFGPFDESENLAGLMWNERVPVFS
jgi:hypothetical protein